jgi:cytochrome c-type biogenesis protein CcmH
MKRHFPVILSVLTLALLLAGLAFNIVVAQGSTPTDDDVNAIAKQLYCPVCENTPLDVCPTEACRQWRGLIRQQLADGPTEDQIKQYFVENYGARVLGEPPRSGLNWVVYLLPPALILAGAFALIRAMRAWMKPPVTETGAGAGETPQSAASTQDEYISKFEEELRKRK